MALPTDSVEREEDLRDWLRDRRPEVPAAFLSPLLQGEARASAGPEGLEKAGAEAIAEALAAPGRNRTAAFRLLAGDALLTYACEATAEEERPGETLEILLKRLGDRFR
ncbi:MAG: hypothetical protein ACQET1_00725 [Gemmatimonadota bacterium]